MLTKAQKKTITYLKTLKEIHYGVNWYGIKEGKYRYVQLDGRVCNALVNKGILVADKDTSYVIRTDKDILD